jgi:hypothetical protein
MLELILLWKCGKDILERARKKGRRGWLWVSVLVCAWFSIEVVSAVAIVLVWQYCFEERPDRFMVYVPSLFLALFGAIMVGKVLDRQQSLLLPVVPNPPQAIPPNPRRARAFPSPTTPPVPLPTASFKFPCPNCGQRVSATLDLVGTATNCPTCDGPFVGPAHGPPA